MNMYHVTENFSSLKEDYEFDQNLEVEDPLRFPSETAPPSPSSSACFPNTMALEKHTAGNSSPKPEFLFSSKKRFNGVESTKSVMLQPVDSGMCHRRKPFIFKARKVGKHRSLSRDMVNYSVESKDWLLCTKRRASQSSPDCFKRRHIKCKPLPRTCPDVDLDRNTPLHLPKSAPLGVLDVVGDNQEQHVHGPFDVCRRGFGMDRDGMKGEEKSDSFGVLDLVSHNQVQHVHGPSDACRRGFGMDREGTKSEEMDEEEKCGLYGQRQTPFLLWFTGLIIQAARFQLKCMLGLCISMVLAWHHSFRFVLNAISYMRQAKGKVTEAHEKEYTRMNMVTFAPKRKDGVFSVRPAFSTGARRLAFGCTTALYTTIILTILFVASLVLSFFLVKGFVYEPVQLYEYLYFDYTKPLPAASVDFASSKVYPDTGSMIKRIARPTTRFRATVFLTVPESEFNKELGIFQVTAELLSVTGQVLLSRTQPCMLRFKSSVLQYAKSSLMAIPLLTGFYSETQSLAVSSLEWKEQRAVSFAAVRVVLAPRAGRPLHTGLPELYEAGLSVKSEIPWWVSIVGHWRWTISVWIGLTLFIGVVVLMLCLCKQFLLPDLGRVLSVVTGGIVQRDFHS